MPRPCGPVKITKIAVNVHLRIQEVAARKFPAAPAVAEPEEAAPSPDERLARLDAQIAAAVAERTAVEEERQQRLAQADAARRAKRAARKAAERLLAQAAVRAEEKRVVELAELKRQVADIKAVLTGRPAPTTPTGEGGCLCHPKAASEAFENNPYAMAYARPSGRRIGSRGHHRRKKGLS